MTKELFTRHGEPYKGEPLTTTTGAPYFVRPSVCGRCGGVGRAEQWARTGYVCYDCGGNGKGADEVVKLYTAEKLAKLNAAKAIADEKRRAKNEAKRAKFEAEAAANAEAFRLVNADLIARTAPHMGNEFIADVMGKALRWNNISEKQAAAVLAAVDRIEAQAKARASSGHVGKPGERIEVQVTVERIAHFERPKYNANWITEVFYIVTMRDDAGNAIISKGTSFTAEKGKKLVLRATIKDHSEYNGEKQTVVQRVKVLEVKT